MIWQGQEQTVKAAPLQSWPVCLACACRGEHQPSAEGSGAADGLEHVLPLLLASGSDYTLLPDAEQNLAAALQPHMRTRAQQTVMAATGMEDGNCTELAPNTAPAVSLARTVSTAAAAALDAAGALCSRPCIVFSNMTVIQCAISVDVKRLALLDR